jgi:hypothetical protein
MKRQERLSKIFSWFHGLVGGKSSRIVPRWFPDQRMGLFLITMLLNIWLMYDAYLTDKLVLVSCVCTCIYVLSITAVFA